MSGRTSQANRAIAEAWSKEQDLVREGKGTRDWIPEQQQDILDKGKAYDDSGKAFEGHHMKSAEKYPEYQGDAENIQFLSRPEHFTAHNGNFQNPTNGYFNPYTGITKDFGLNKYEPCEIVKLSKPVVSTNHIIRDSTENTEPSAIENSSNSDAVMDSTPKRINGRNLDTNTLKPHSLNCSVKSESGFKHFFGKTLEFYVQHKGVIDPIVGVVVAVTPTVIKEIFGGKSKSYSSEYSTSGNEENSIDEEYNSTSVESSEKTGRASPHQHTVSEHKQRYNGVWKDKKPYPRGKNKDN